MITAQIISDSPVLMAKIQTKPNSLRVRVTPNHDKLIAKISFTEPIIRGKIKKPVSKEMEPYYEVSNEYGTTIVIGE